VTDEAPNPYAMSLDDLERTAHVPPEEQVEEQPEPAHPDPLDGDWQDQQRFLRQAGGA
jgi:hypothetical protein